MDRPKAFLFDLDGALIDSEPLHGQAWQETSAFFNLKLSSQQIKILQGRRRLDCAEKIIEWINKPIQIEELLSIHKPISRKLIQKAKAIPGSESLVKWCYNNQLPIALVTSSSRDSFKFKSTPHKWLDLFQVKVLGDDNDLSRGKPFPDPYFLAASKLNVEASSCWVLEDSISGATSAIKAGCKVWLLNHEGGGSKKKEISASIDKVTEINNLENILNILKEIYN